MDEYFLKHDAKAQFDTCCMNCGTIVQFPVGAHDGDRVLCPVCGNKVELVKRLLVRCRFCAVQVGARERDIGNEFKCPLCGRVMKLELSDIDLSDGSMISAYPDLFGDRYGQVR